MPNRRLSLRMIKEVLRLYYSCGLSHKKISKALGCSHGSVAEYLVRARAAGLNWPLPEDLDDSQIERRLYPPVSQNNSSGARQQPDCIAMHLELKKRVSP